MNHAVFNLKTPDGTSPCHVFCPDGAGPLPAVIFFMDGLGIRQELISMAERIAQGGYFVLLPNLYYRLSKESEFDVSKVFSDPAEYQKMIYATSSLTDAMVIRDIRGFLSYLDSELAVASDRLGAVGYCLGGGMVMRAMINFPERFAVGASFHGGNLINDTPASPHRSVDRIKGHLYLGLAEVDEWLPAESVERLIAALDEAGANYQAEVYEGTRHGWAVRDIPVHHPQGAALHWQRLFALLGSKLRSDAGS